MKALVTGGTGTLGRLVVPRLQDAGYDVRVLSRHRHDGLEGFEFVTGDLATGEEIDAAVEGTEIIVHLAGDKKGDEHKAQNLVRAASRNGTQHLVYISVVGADRIPVLVGSIAPCSATSHPSLPPNRSWPIPACRGQRCAPRSSISRCCCWCSRWPGCL